MQFFSLHNFLLILRMWMFAFKMNSKQFAWHLWIKYNYTVSECFSFNFNFPSHFVAPFRGRRHIFNSFSHLIRRLQKTHPKCVKSHLGSVAIIWQVPGKLFHLPICSWNVSGKYWFWFSFAINAILFYNFVHYFFSPAEVCRIFCTMWVCQTIWTRVTM